MSLINQMLKDLEARKPQGSPQPSQHVEVVACPPAKKSQRRLIVLLLVGLLLLSAGAGWWWLVRVDERAPHIVENGVASPVNVEPVAPSVAQQVVDPVVAEVVTRVAVESISKVHKKVDTLTVPNEVVADIENAALSPVVDAFADVVKEDSGDSAVKEQLTQDPPVVAATLVIEPPSAADQAQQLRNKARNQASQQHYRAAVQLFDQAMLMDGGRSQHWLEFIRLCVQARDLPLALDVAQRACEQYPNDLDLRVYRARLLVESGEYTRALSMLQLDDAPPVDQLSDYYALRASVLQQLKRFSEAEAQYALLTAHYPQQGDWWVGRAICAEQIGAAQQAIVYYQQAMACRQLNPQLKQFAVEQLVRLRKG